TEAFVLHPDNPKLSRLLTPAEHARVKGIPETMGHGLSDTTAHEGYDQAVIFNKFEAVGLAIGWFLRGLSMPSRYYGPKRMVADVGGGSAGAESFVKAERWQAEVIVAQTTQERPNPSEPMLGPCSLGVTMTSAINSPS